MVTKHQAVLLHKHKPEQHLRNALAVLLPVLAMHAEPKLAKNKAKRLVTVLVLPHINVAEAVQADTLVLAELAKKIAHQITVP